VLPPAITNLDPDGEEIVATVADREGGNGLPYLSSGDPRTARMDTVGSDKNFPYVLVPAKWHYDPHKDPFNPCSPGDNCWGDSNQWIPVELTSGVEAVLIRAEAALHQHPAASTWLRLLNQLRATAPIPGTEQPEPAKLPPLKDPGTEHGRIALLFAERAAWLFLTGHRQGDLRRLVRNYHWPQDQVYPSGPYIVPKSLGLRVAGTYGPDVNLPIPLEERVNPYFHGCLDRGA
jgi:hypothetical protein